MQMMAKVPGYRPGMERPLTTSGIPLYELPKRRLAECVEFICSVMDWFLSVDLDKGLLSVIVWQLTGVKPDLRICKFHAKSYLDLYLQLRIAHERMKCTGQFDKEYLEKLFLRTGMCWAM